MPSNIPPQYRDLPADVVDELWTVKEYMDPAKTAAEKERKAAALRELREQEVQMQKDNTTSSVRHVLEAAQSPTPEPITEADITTMNNDAWKIDKANNGDVNLDLMLNNVDGDIGERFDAHGIAKVSHAYQLRSLIGLLNNGIDTTRDFHSAPLAFSAKNRGAGAGFGIAGGANDTGSFVVMGDIDTPILKGGIKYVIVNDAFYGAMDRLARAYPHITFIKANRANQELTRLVEIHDRQEASR